MQYFFFLISFAICLVMTPAVRYFAIRKGWMAKPVKDRWHSKPTALMGGIAIYTGMAAPLFFAADFSSFLQFSSEPGKRMLPALDAVIWLGISLSFLLGLVDDFLRIKPQTKLVGQILIASLVTFLGFRLQWFESLTLDTMITIIWIVGISNALNLIDNMDGLCTGVSLIASLFFVLLFSAGGTAGMIPALLLAGSLAAFLIYNFNPASIFMGDSGSLLIGFCLSMLGIHYSASGHATNLGAVAVPVMILLVPILDTTMVTLIRLLSGRKASAGGRDHTSHRLVLVGFSEREAAIFLYGVGFMSGIGAWFVSSSDTLSSPAAIIPLGIAVLLMGIYMAQIRVYPEKEFSVLRNRSYTPILMELTYKKQIAMVILDFGLVAFSYYLSYRLRFSGDEFIFYFKIFLHSLPAIIACKFIVFYIMGTYRGIWRFMSSDDVFGFIKASAMASLFSVVAVTYIYRFQDFSKGIFVIDWLLTTGLLLGTRGSFRIAVDVIKRKTAKGENVLIYGAGRGGEILLREILNNKLRRLKPIGFIDDDTFKSGKKLLGYPILGTFRDMDALQKKYQFSTLLISFNGKKPNNFEGAREYCKKNELILRRFSVRLEDVELE
ncbi:MAG: glycosyl transferase [Desulfococcaceae bacterium]|jgi:UDP-GlcNAc:undecaprenyl-phosphate GlcNAc-1-phosphate transferase|nr:glycosyl transferase [Desulfococcaceae bacterium]